MRASAIRRPVKGAALVLTVSGLLALFPGMGHAADSAALSCSGSTTFTVRTDAQGDVGGTATMDLRCTRPGSAGVLAGHASLTLPPQKEAADTPPPASEDDKVISWSDGTSSELRAAVSDLVEQDVPGHGTVPILIEQGTVTRGTFAGLHYASEITNPVWSGDVTDGERVTSPMMMVISAS
jgi:hypothetical protein